MKGVLFMPIKFDKNKLKDIERYDDFIKNSKHLPYTPTILTKYERSIMESLAIDVSDKVKTYADIPTSVLKRYIQKYSEVDYYNPLKKIVEQKNKDFSKKEIEEFIRSLEYILFFDHNKPKGVSDEKKSILNILSNSKYYNDNKKEIEESFEKRYKSKFKELYFDKNDMMLLITTLFKSIPNNINEELENRKKFLNSKKSRDESDFIRMSQKMKKLYESGEFTKGDKLLNYYTYHGNDVINSTARNNLSIEELDVHDSHSIHQIWDEFKKSRIIPEDLFLKTIIELSKIRKRIEEQGNIPKTPEQLISGKYLYRGLSLKNFFKTIQESKDWHLTKEEILEKDLRKQVINYLKGKISIDPAVLSTSLDENAAIDFINGFPGVLLKIDVTKHNKGLDIHENSPYDEKEILLSPGTKLKITDVVYNSNKDYFEISCVPV